MYTNPKKGEIPRLDHSDRAAYCTASTAAGLEPTTPPKERAHRYYYTGATLQKITAKRLQPSLSERCKAACLRVPGRHFSNRWQHFFDPTNDGPHVAVSYIHETFLDGVL